MLGKILATAIIGAYMCKELTDGYELIRAPWEYNKGDRRARFLWGVGSLSLLIITAFQVWR